MPFVFSCLNKTSGTTELIKADSKAQAQRFVAANFALQRADALQVAELMQAGALLHDATAMPEDSPETKGGAGAAAHGNPEGGAAGEAGAQGGMAPGAQAAVEAAPAVVSAAGAVMAAPPTRPQNGTEQVAGSATSPRGFGQRG